MPKPPTTETARIKKPGSIDGGDHNPEETAGRSDADAGDPSEGVGSRLRYLRDMHGLSQRELARRAGLTHGTIGSIERDAISPSVGSLRKILDSFPMTLSEFFALNPDSETQVFFGHGELMEVGGDGFHCARWAITSRTAPCKFSWSATPQEPKRQRHLTATLGMKAVW